MDVCTLIKKSVCTFSLVFVDRRRFVGSFDRLLCRQVLHLYSFLIPTSVGWERKTGPGWVFQCDPTGASISGLSQVGPKSVTELERRYV